MANIRISQLNDFTVIKREDFVPLVDSSSMTTYRVSVSSVGAWMTDSGSCLSASWSSHSLSTVSSSWASRSLVTVSSSWASHSLSTVSGSWASHSLSSVSASWASRSLATVSASWASASLATVSASWASASLATVSASWASASISSSYTQTASYALAIPSSGPVTVPGTVPIGSIMDYAGTSISDPSWLVCNGAAISRTTYATLFAAIGTTWGIGDGINTFNIPDLRKRMTIGARTPVVGTLTQLSQSVGNIGGGEAYQWHYHLQSINYVATVNDDCYIPMVGYNSGITNQFMYPIRDGVCYYWYITGDAGTRYQPAGNVHPLTSNTAHPMLNTSYPINEIHDWFTDSTINSVIASQAYAGATPKYTRQDLSMPYAVTNKIIRVA